MGYVNGLNFIYRVLSVCQVIGFQSSKNTTTTEVPQRSILSNLLFTLYINNMANACDDMESLHFADDTTLFLLGNNISSDFSIEGV